MSKDKGDLTTFAGEEDKILREMYDQKVERLYRQKNMHDQLNVFLKATLNEKSLLTMCLSMAHLAWENYFSQYNRQ